MTTNSNITVPVATLIARRNYDRRVFGRNGYMHTSELTTDHESNEHVIKSIMTEVSPTEARSALRPLLPPGKHCQGGYIWVYDTDYPCSGCVGCRPASINAWAIATAIWSIGVSAEHAVIRQAVTGLEALALIGKHIEAALSPGVAISNFFQGVIHDYHQVRKGNFYRVVGTRGRARDNQGVEGECVWVGESGGRTYGNGRRAYTVGGTTRVGLKQVGATVLVYVPASQVMRIPLPAVVQAQRDAAAAAKAARGQLPKFTGGKGSTAYIIGGKDYTPIRKEDKDQGITASCLTYGKVFWIGTGNGGTERAGLKTPDGRTLWVDLVDLSNPPILECGSEGSIEVEVMCAAIGKIGQVVIERTAAQPKKRTRKTVKKAA